MHTMGKLTDLYIRGRVERHEIMRTTIKSYRDALRYLCRSVGRQTLVRDVTRHDLDVFIAEQASHIATSTLRGRLTVVRLFFAWATLDGHISKNPCIGVRLPKKPRSVPRGLPDEAIARVLAATKDERESLMVSLMVREGLRSIEVSRLEMADVDRASMTLRLVGKALHERIVPLTSQTARRLDAYFDAERGRRSGRLIQSRNRSVWNPEDGIQSRTIFVQVSRAMKRAGVAESAHALRHSAAYGLLDAGARVQDVQEFLGHVSLVTTQIYMPRSRVEELRPFVGQKDYSATFSEAS